MAELIRHHPHHDPVLGEVPVPHGPETGGEHDHYPRRPVKGDPESEQSIFAYLTHPDDSYTPEGIYWADLPLRQRVSFVNKVQNEEAMNELRTIGRMIKKDPLSPLSWYFRNAVLPGAGLGLEGYVLFSIGNLTPLFSAVWPTCWGKTPTDCSENWVASVTYLEVIGIMVGQLGVGVIGDWIGRRWGLIQDAAIMFIGLLMLTASWGLNLNGWVICYAWSLFFYGFGVGGEYPITATSSMENAVTAGKLSTREDRLHRGRKVTMSFLMQGWGQLINQGLLIILLLILHHGDGDPPYSDTTVQWVFRLSFAIPAIGTLWLVYFRTYKMPHASRQLAAAKKKNNVTGYDLESLKMCYTHFGGRLFAAAGGWFCNDVFFYGNKLFQSQFIAVISNNPKSVMVGWVWNLLNVIVSLLGYYLASFMIDNKFYGRKMMQQVGFLMCFIFFVVPAFKYDYYTSPAGIKSFQAMYFLSSFFNQFGPNSVTFLVAGEIFPTPVRASAHGFSACIGKAGALLASVLYNYIDTQTKFYVVPWFGLAGMVITWLFLPDTTGLDLKEQERRWFYIRSGRGDEYHGIAVHPVHLSLWERMRGAGKNYNPELDQKQRIEDMREEWAGKERSRRDKEVSGDASGTADLDDDDDWSDAVNHYFRNTTSDDKLKMQPGTESNSEKGVSNEEAGDKIGNA
ncbi:major facilitator superfamily domain-containing protein [Lasiosphaeria miniovina]|uniref:Major facilitator superfamily domain-containing protein n=1 Tax=Lasiosphaeria miniovina TaxID=1954250 RepID=A0AA40AJG1_9PEZI|nr:major facilitator superfamily domain-containing protein [Lasiosphaeria miniovina]KAK0716957.1 major facilitator superfamily domain-containing protein [Lasiosphaeria miniovina]